MLERDSKPFDQKDGRSIQEAMPAGKVSAVQKLSSELSEVTPLAILEGRVPPPPSHALRVEEDRQFHVVWEIDVWAGSFEDAARKALATQKRPDSEATVFGVYDVEDPKGVLEQVDLTAIDEDGEVAMPVASVNRGNELASDRAEVALNEVEGLKSRMKELGEVAQELYRACQAANAYLGDPPSKFPENRAAAAEIIDGAEARYLSFNRFVEARDECRNTVPPPPPPGSFASN